MTKDERIAAMKKRRERAREALRATPKKYHRGRQLYQAQVVYYEAVLVELERL